MFGRIARRYNLLNSLISLGRDAAWRREAIQRLTDGKTPPAPALYLDAGCGTGDLALELLARHPQAAIIASDLTPEMVAVARQRPGAENIVWVIADAQHLPFRSGRFAGIVSGYLLRNVADLDRTLREQNRLLQSGGRMVSLDTTHPARNLLLPFITFYYRRIIPLLGKLIAGDSQAYTYLPETSANFLDADTLAARIRAAGFSAVSFVRRMFGTQAIHTAQKDQP